MKTPKSVCSSLIRGALFAALSAAPAFAISNEELAKLRAQAENGNAIAQYNLGLQYASVSESFADPIEAYVWLNLAADNGATGRALVLLNSQLTPEQISEGKQRLEARRAQLAAKKAGAPTPVSAPAAPVQPAASPIVAAAPSTSGSGLIVPAGTNDDAASLQAELKKMSAELSAAWKENETLKASLSKAGQSSTDVEQLRREKSELSSNLANATKEISVLRAANANIEGERNSLQEKLAAAEKLAKDGAGAELASVTAKLKSTEAELKQASSAAKDLENAKQIIGSLGQRIDTLTAENQRLNSLASKAGASDESRAAAEKELATVRSDLQKAQAQLAEAATKTTASADAQKQLEDTQVKLESALRSYDLQQKEVDRLQKALANIDGERESLSKQLADAKAAPTKPDAQVLQQVAQLTSDLDAAKKSLGQIDGLKRELADAQGQAKAAQDDLARLTQERDSLRTQLAAAVAAPAKPDAQTLKQVADLTSELDAARKSLAQVEPLKRDLEDAQAKLKAAQDTATQAQQEKANVEKQLAVAKAAGTAPTGDVARLTAEIKDSRARLVAADQAIGRLREERERAVQQAAQDAQQQLAQAGKELQDVREQANAAQTALAKANQERDSLAQQLAAAQASTKQAPAQDGQISELRNQLAASQQALATANNERSTLAQRISELEAQQKAAASAPAATPAPTVASTATPAAPSEEQPDLRKELEQTQAKLEAALRTYTLQQEEVDRLQKALANIDNERAQLADRLTAESAKVSEVSSQAASNQDAAAQLASVREQLRQAQNQIASLASENTQLKNRVALSGPPPSSLLAAPLRPGTAAAQAVSRPAAPTPAPEARTHTVADGDTLTRIAKRYYGSSSRWNEILEANRSVIRDPNNLTVGTKLRIP